MVLHIKALVYRFATYCHPSPNQVLTHAARAAAKQLKRPPLVAARGAREGLWLEQLSSLLSLYLFAFVAVACKQIEPGKL